MIDIIYLSARRYNVDISEKEKELDEVMKGRNNIWKSAFLWIF